MLRRSMAIHFTLLTWSGIACHDSSYKSSKSDTVNEYSSRSAACEQQVQMFLNITAE